LLTLPSSREFAAGAAKILAPWMAVARLLGEGVGAGVVGVGVGVVIVDVGVGVAIVGAGDGVWLGVTVDVIGGAAVVAGGGVVEAGVIVGEGQPSMIAIRAKVPSRSNTTMPAPPPKKKPSRCVFLRLIIAWACFSTLWLSG
jgi:hypothetical protein